MAVHTIICSNFGPETFIGLKFGLKLLSIHTRKARLTSA